MIEPNIEDYREYDDFPHKYIKDMEIYDDEITWAVDIPQCLNGIPIDEMRTVAEFKTKEEAIKYAKEYFGADDQGMICLISSY